MKPIVTVLAAAIAVLASLPAPGAEIRIAIEDIPPMAQASSPLAIILESELGKAEAEHDLLKRWSNPSFAWELEEVGDGDVSLREWTVAVEKDFQLPWYSTKNSAGRDLRVSAARLGYEAARWRLVSRLRRGYVAILLRDTEARLLGDFENIIGEAGRVVAERKEQGTISGVEKRLIEMSLLSVRARIVTIRNERRELMDEWKSAMGIGYGDSVVLVSEPDLTRDWLSAHAGLAGSSSELESRRLAAEALSMDIGAEKASLMPSMTLAGGYKSAEDELTGFVVGVSFPLPLLNRNSAGVDMAKAEQRKASAALDLYESSRAMRISRLKAAAGESSALLKRYSGDPMDISRHVADLAASYREGWIDLGDFLEGVQTYGDGTEQYFDVLEDYYGMVFELEELTEQEIFAPGTARKEEAGS